MFFLITKDYSALPTDSADALKIVSSLPTTVVPGEKFDVEVHLMASSWEFEDSTGENFSSSYYASS